MSFSGPTILRIKIRTVIPIFLGSSISLEKLRRLQNVTGIQKTKMAALENGSTFFSVCRLHRHKIKNVQSMFSRSGFSMVLVRVLCYVTGSQKTTMAAITTGSTYISACRLKNSLFFRFLSRVNTRKSHISSLWLLKLYFRVRIPYQRMLEALVELTVTESNRYAEQQGKEFETTSEEVKAFFGIL